MKPVQFIFYKTLTFVIKTFTQVSLKRFFLENLAFFF